MSRLDTTIYGFHYLNALKTICHARHLNDLQAVFAKSNTIATIKQRQCYFHLPSFEKVSTFELPAGIVCDPHFLKMTSNVIISTDVSASLVKVIHRNSFNW